MFNYLFLFNYLDVFGQLFIKPDPAIGVGSSEL
jgi:hypothetical protein